MLSFKNNSEIPQPTSPKNFIRFLVGVIIVLAYLAGYYHSLWQLETQKNTNPYKMNTEQGI